MADQMYLVVTLRKAVADRPEGDALFETVKQRLSDRPGIKVSGHVVNHFEETEIPT